MSYFMTSNVYQLNTTVNMENNKKMKRTKSFEKQVNFRISATTLEELDEIAESKGLSTAALVRYWIFEKIKKERRRQEEE